jgi:hypothetical protein
MVADQNLIVATTSASDTDMTMSAQRGIISIAICGLLLSWTAVTPSIAASLIRSQAGADVDACTLLTAADASKALEATSLPGKRLVASSSKVCMWSDDSSGAITHRRVTLSMTSLTGFQFAKSTANPKITIEPVTGIGDEAYYELFKGDSPFLVVRKGNTTFNVRILNGLKLKAFTLEQEKAKEADLAKAAAAKL